MHETTPIANAAKALQVATEKYENAVALRDPNAPRLLAEVKNAESAYQSMVLERIRVAQPPQN